MRLLFILTILSKITLARRQWKTSDPCPNYIKTRIPSESAFGTMAATHAALVTCPNITKLDLTVSLDGCTGGPDRWNFAFDPAGKDRYPNLKIVKLNRYSFDNEDDYSKNQGQVSFQGVLEAFKHSWHGFQDIFVAKPQSNFALWLAAMNWSSVEELSLKTELTSEVIETLPKQLSSLRKLSLANTPFITALPKHSLEELSWIATSKPTDLPSILASQGPSLRTLEFRCEELSCPDFPLQVNTSLLHTHAPNLSHLALNIPRNGSWPLKILEDIASLPKLKTADIYLRLQAECLRTRAQKLSMTRQDWRKYLEDSECKRTNLFQKPWLDDSGALEMYKAMLQKNEGLGKVTFWAGDWSEPWTGPIYEPDWLEERQVQVECEKEGKSEGEAWCKILKGREYWMYGADSGGYDWQTADELEEMEEMGKEKMWFIED